MQGVRGGERDRLSPTSSVLLRGQSRTEPTLLTSVLRVSVFLSFFPSQKSFLASHSSSTGCCRTNSVLVIPQQTTSLSKLLTLELVATQLNRNQSQRWFFVPKGWGLWSSMVSYRRTSSHWFCALSSLFFSPFYLQQDQYVFFSLRTPHDLWLVQSLTWENPFQENPSNSDHVRSHYCSSATTKCLQFLSAKCLKGPWLFMEKTITTSSFN